MSEIVIYKAEDGCTTLEVSLEADTVWLSQRQMAELFEKDTDTIGLHIRNLYKEGELLRVATTEESSVVRDGGDGRFGVKYNSIASMSSFPSVIESTRYAALNSANGPPTFCAIIL